MHCELLAIATRMEEHGAAEACQPMLLASRKVEREFGCWPLHTVRSLLYTMSPQVRGSHLVVVAGLQGCLAADMLAQLGWKSVQTSISTAAAHACRRHHTWRPPARVPPLWQGCMLWLEPPSCQHKHAARAGMPVRGHRCMQWCSGLLTRQPDSNAHYSLQSLLCSGHELRA